MAAKKPAKQATGEAATALPVQRRPILTELFEAHAAFSPVLARLAATRHPKAKQYVERISQALGPVAGVIKEFAAVLQTSNPSIPARKLFGRPVPTVADELAAAELAAAEQENA